MKETLGFMLRKKEGMELYEVRIGIKIRRHE